jgi:energy-converting hydrogenase B subunit G
VGFYDKIINSFKNITDIKQRVKDDSATTDSVSSALAAELTLISTILIASLLLRHIHIILTIIVVLVLCLILITSMPLIPKFTREQSDSLEKMTFYAILTLGILAMLIYWGTDYV